MADETQGDFFERVHDWVRQVPTGFVTTYGDVAEALGARSAARTVGWALNGAPPDVPCQRVVNRDGALTGRRAFGDPNLMRELLLIEGVTFTDDGRVDLARHRWPGPDGVTAPTVGRA